MFSTGIHSFIHSIILSLYLLQFAELEKRVNAGWSDYEAALKETDKTYTAHMYPGVNHGFHNNTTPRYDEATATIAWDRTIAFFEKHLV